MSHLVHDHRGLCIDFTGCTPNRVPDTPAASQDAIENRARVLSSFQFHHSLLDDVGPLPYQPPLTTPFDFDKIQRAQYLKAHRAGWELVIVNNAFSTCCFAAPAVDQGFFDGQGVALQLTDRYSGIPVFDSRRELTRKEIEAHPVENWYVPRQENEPISASDQNLNVT